MAVTAARGAAASSCSGAVAARLEAARARPGAVAACPAASSRERWWRIHQCRWWRGSVKRQRLSQPRPQLAWRPWRHARRQQRLTLKRRRLARPRSPPESVGGSPRGDGGSPDTVIVVVPWVQLGRTIAEWLPLAMVAGRQGNNKVGVPQLRWVHVDDAGHPKAGASERRHRSNTCSGMSASSRHTAQSAAGHLMSGHCGHLRDGSRSMWCRCTGRNVPSVPLSADAPSRWSPGPLFAMRRGSRLPKILLKKLSGHCCCHCLVVVRTTSRVIVRTSADSCLGGGGAQLSPFPARRRAPSKESHRAGTHCRIASGWSAMTVNRHQTSAPRGNVWAAAPLLSMLRSPGRCPLLPQLPRGPLGWQRALPGCSSVLSRRHANFRLLAHRGQERRQHLG